MRKFNFVSLAAALIISVLFCSCSKEKEQNNFDHFEVEYKLETNLDCRNCFNSDYQLLFNGKVATTGAVTQSVDGSFTNNDADPNSTITFKTVSSFIEPIPAKVDFYLKYDITIMAIGKDGGVLESIGVKETRSFDNVLDLTTPENQKIALDSYTINFEAKSTLKDGKIIFVAAN